VTCNGPEERYNADEKEFGRGGEVDCETKRRGSGIGGRGGRGCDFEGSDKGKFECCETSKREARSCDGLEGGLRTGSSNVRFKLDFTALMASSCNRSLPYDFDIDMGAGDFQLNPSCDN
jgi:hypothetical protein